MNIVTLRCNECGAPLEVPDAARYVTCTHCNCQLSIQRTASAVFTEKLDQISAKTDAIAGNLDIIRIQNDIEMLDREWAAVREKYMMKGVSGARREPGTESIFRGIVIATFGLAIILSPSGKGSYFSQFVFGFILLCAPIFIHYFEGRKAAKLKSHRVVYESRRAKLLRELSRVRQA